MPVVYAPCGALQRSCLSEEVPTGGLGKIMVVEADCASILPLSPSQLGSLSQILFILVFVRRASCQTSKGPVFVPVNAPRLAVAQHRLVKREPHVPVGQVGKGP